MLAVLRRIPNFAYENTQHQLLQRLACLITFTLSSTSLRRIIFQSTASSSFADAEEASALILLCIRFLAGLLVSTLSRLSCLSLILSPVVAVVAVVVVNSSYFNSQFDMFRSPCVSNRPTSAPELQRLSGIRPLFSPQPSTTASTSIGNQGGD